MLVNCILVSSNCCCRFFRSCSKTIPIIAMTANAFKEDIERCLESGMNGHISKPVDYDALIRELLLHLSPGL